MSWLMTRVEVCLPICAWSAALSLLGMSEMHPVKTSTDHTRTTLTAVIFSAFVLSLMFTLVWEPVKEFLTRSLTRGRSYSGHPSGFLPMIIMIGIGMFLVAIHYLMDEFINENPYEVIGVFLERASIVFLVSFCWFVPSDKTMIIIIIVVLIVMMIAYVSKILVAVNLLHLPWTDSEVFFTLPCAIIAVLGQARSITESEARKLFGLIISALLMIVFVSGLFHFANTLLISKTGYHISSLFIYTHDAEHPEDWCSAIWDDMLFYMGWAIGTYVVFQTNETMNHEQHG